MKRFFYSFLLLFTFISALIKAQPNAFCSTPVADLVQTSMYHAQKQNLPVKTNEQQPFSDKPGDYACTRLSQLLFNEQVEIIEQLGDEYKIKIFHWYHQAGTPPKKIVTYWVNKKAVTPFKKISKNEFSKLPAPVSFATQTIPIDNTVVLTDWYKNYSAGTRFIKTPHQRNRKHFSVYCYDPLKKKFKTIKLPRSLCIDKVPKTARGKRKIFVSILKKWISDQSGYTPYVFGGASIGKPYKNNNFKIKTVKTPRKTVTLFDRNRLDTTGPKYGIDCAHTIARAAQIAGINYFVKNTSTLKNTFAPLSKKQTIEDGDILVWKGHTAVVSNAKKGLLIEARGYEHGYGIVQEIPFNQQFKGINTSKQLKDRFLSKRPIDRLNKDGEKVQTIRDLMIIKLPVT